MVRSEMRKKLLRYYDLLKEIKSVKSITSNERDNQTKEIKALEEKINKLEKELYNDKTISRNK